MSSDLETTMEPTICPVCSKPLKVKLAVHMKNKHPSMVEAAKPRDRVEKSIRKMFNLRVNEPMRVIKVREPLVPEGDPHYVYPEAQTVHLLVFLDRPLGHGNNVYISGPSGTGKTQLLLNVADKLNWPVTRIDCDSHMTRSSLIGAWTVRNKETVFQHGALALAMMKGHILLLNEYDTINPMVANILKPVLDRKPTLVILENGAEVIHAHPDFRVVATANTWARGDDSGQFVNTHIQSTADLRRFGAFIKMDFLDPKVEAQMLRDTFGKDEKGDWKLEEEEVTSMVKVATKIREAHQARKINRTLSPAECINWAYTYLELTSVYEAARLTFLNSYAPDEQVACFAMIEEVWGVEKKHNPIDDEDDLSALDPSKLSTK